MKQLNLYYIGGGEQKPDGRTVVPTDDIQIWLKCAGLNKPYTTLAEVLADSSTLEALIADSNAVDYLVRSTSFAKSEALVPTMTSDNTPSGVCSASSVYGADNPAWKGFDGVDSVIGDSWCCANGQTSNQYLAYEFPSNKRICSVKLHGHPTSATWNPKNIKFQYYDNGSWVDVPNSATVFPSTTDTQTYVYSTPVESTKHRLYITDSYNSSMVHVSSLQFYSEEGLTDNATAMSYIGLNNYASNTLLADSTWCSAICNSTYFESVLNVKVPTMTSDTTPSGVVSADTYESGYNPYKAFSSSSYWWVNTTNYVGHWIQYKFPSAVKINRIDLSSSSSINTNAVWELRGSNDGSNFETIPNSSGSYTSSNYKKYFVNTTAYKYYRFYCTSATGITSSLTISSLQFYGRADI